MNRFRGRRRRGGKGFRETRPPLLGGGTQEVHMHVVRPQEAVSLPMIGIIPFPFLLCYYATSPLVVAFFPTSGLLNSPQSAGKGITQGWGVFQEAK